MTCILVDIDGTLLDGPSSEILFAAHLIRHLQLGPRQLATAALFVPRWGPRYGRHVFRKNKAYLAGLEVENVAALAEEFVHAELEPRLRPTLIARIEAHRAAGDRIAILSGTPEFIARPLAERVGAEAWTATRCARHGGAFTDDPPEVHPFFREKVERSHELCARLGCHLGDCVAYGNSVYDLPLLRRVAEPIVVCPDWELEKVACDQGWEVLDA